MASIEKFEDLICWQKARELVKSVYKEFQGCRDLGFKDQIQRAAISVMSNIAEGFERGTTQEFLNYLYIAKGSAGEVRSQLYAAFDTEYLNIETFKYLNNLASECSRLIQSFAYKVKGGSRRGLQFKHIKKIDATKEILRQYAPEVYKRFYEKE
ncbi:MAG: four helix bundle protein [Patescibacteria group bacterium]